MRLERCSPRDDPSSKRLKAAALAFLGYSLAMLVPDRRMHEAGGPGIIPFELAGNASRAEAIMGRWGRSGERAARLSLHLDFGYMATYGVFAGLLVDRARRRRNHPAAVLSAVVVAVGADAVEGVCLLRVLARRDVGPNARRAQIAAVTKFAALAGCLGYAAKR